MSNYTATSDRIGIHAELTDTHESTRALTLYFALPISATEEWTWDDDIRARRNISGIHEFANFSQEYGGIGANGNLSKYPWANLSGPWGGIALGIPLDSPRAMRLVYNPVKHQFYVAIDLGLSPHTTDFPSHAWADLVIYNVKHPQWGFRAATQGYYERFPQFFERRIPPEQEGIWVAFSPVCTITDVLDFGIGFHEIGDLGMVPCDDENGILSFRYLVEPSTMWLPLNSLPLLNPGFEDGPSGSADHWEGFMLDSNTYTYTVDENGGCCGSQALVLPNDVPADNVHGGARQVIILNQTKALPIYIGGLSKAQNISGQAHNDYSLYLDILYNDDTWLYGQMLTFDTGTHPWQLLEGFIIPDSNYFDNVIFQICI